MWSLCRDDLFTQLIWKNIVEPSSCVAEDFIATASTEQEIY